MNDTFAGIVRLMMLIAWGVSVLCILGTLLYLETSGQYRAYSDKHPIVLSLETLTTVVAFWGAAVTFCLSSIYLRSDGISRRAGN